MPRAESMTALLMDRLKEDEQEACTAAGMHATAARLRNAATEMKNSIDRDAMLRLANSFEQRAFKAMRRSSP